MSIVLVTGSAGLIGAESVRFFSGKGFTIVGIFCHKVSPSRAS